MADGYSTKNVKFTLLQVVMALKVKHNRANHTHENEQFRRIASSLKILFKQRNWEGLLIGNPFNELYPRFRADAILLYNHGLVLIDLKDYQGNLKLPPNKSEFEMLQWYTEAESDKKRIVIKAGTKFINPFKQLNAYRETFKELVNTEIQLSSLIQENKTCILNIFSGPLSIENSIPKEIPFYKITQEADLGTFLYDYSSDNSYSEELAKKLSNIFQAEDWLEHVELPKSASLSERTIELDNNLEESISDFLTNDSSSILVLESMSTKDRDNWAQHIFTNSVLFAIPQTEIWIHSARISRKASIRMGTEIQSLFNTIYGGAHKTLEIENSETQEKQYEEQLQELIPIRSDNSLDDSAVIILHEAHLVSRSLHQSELLRFGSGRLLEDLLKFLRLDETKRKLICIGDPYSLSYGKDSESAISLNALAELYDGKISHYRQQPTLEDADGKLGFRNNLARGIENGCFNDLEYPWKLMDFTETKKDATSEFLMKWFTIPCDSEPSNVVMVFANKDAKKINQWIKTNCLKNGKELSKDDLLIINNNINIPDETGFGQPTRLYNGMYILVEEVGESIHKVIPLRQSSKPISLEFTKIKAKCLSLQNKPSAEIWLLNNYFESEDKLSKEEQIAFRVFVNNCLKAEMKNSLFEDSYEYIQLTQDKEHKKLHAEEKDLKARYEQGEKVKTKLDQTQRELKRIENKYAKQHKNRILANIIQTDPLVNAAYASYGWSITVHKAIGSIFTNSIINASQGENQRGTNNQYYRWLYSAVTTTSGSVQIANPPKINPLMEIHFEDTSVDVDDSSNSKKSILVFTDYMPESRFDEKLPTDLNQNVKGSISELAKVLEPHGYLMEIIKPNSEYLTKAHFSTSSNDTGLILAINNKGANDSWGVSSIRIEKSDSQNDSFINESIANLFKAASKNGQGIPISSITDFRRKIYSKWQEILAEKGFDLYLTDSHNNQDVFSTKSLERKAKFRIYYSNDGFITQFLMVSKSDEKLGGELKKWLIDGN